MRRATLSNLVNGKAPEMALRIEKAFGVARDTLLRMQAWHDSHMMRQRAAVTGAGQGAGQRRGENHVPEVGKRVGATRADPRDGALSFTLLPTASPAAFRLTNGRSGSTVEPPKPSREARAKTR